MVESVDGTENQERALLWCMASSSICKETWHVFGMGAERADSPSLLAAHLGEVGGQVGWPTAQLLFSSMAREAQAWEGLTFTRSPSHWGQDKGS